MDIRASKLSSLGYEAVDVQRLSENRAVEQSDFVVQEYPIALVYNGISHAVMMATPADIEVFAKGFSLSEGILTSLKELYSLDIHETEFGIQVEMTISTRAFMALKQHRRMMVGRTGCGLCGIESLQQLHLDLSQITTALCEGWVEAGEIVALFEDVGRHNALDKLLGYIAEHHYDVNQGFVVMTSRASYELIRKCAQMNIALLACISAPTSMAINMAKQSGLTLASFCRGNGFVLYT